MKSCKPWSMGMRRFGRLLVLAWAACVGTAWGQGGPREPHIGYLYPAGGRQGAVIQIRAGGQFLRGAGGVCVSGEGVRASVVGYIGDYRPLNKPQLLEIQSRLGELRQKRPSEPAGAVPTPAPRAKAPAPVITDRPTSGTQPKAPPPKEHPLFKDLEAMNPKELDYVARELLILDKNPGRKQANSQIGETALIEVTINPGAAAGDRELRIVTTAGLTNPLRFQVGQLPEVLEQEPNDPEATLAAAQDGFKPAGPQGRGAPANNRKLNGNVKDNKNNLAAAPDTRVLELPALLNGQILPGDVDRFRFRARKGQKLVLQAQARRLMPYLADAVPGWFQATLALYDASGNEVAYADDYRFDPDPVLFYEVPQDGPYQVEIRDALYRGREDFVYRIAVGELPFITRIFPLGGREGTATVAAAAGLNLPGKQLMLDTQPGPESLRGASASRDGWLSNSLPYAVDTLPESRETEPNDKAHEAQRITLPRIINGHIAHPGDVDAFRFTGHARDKVAAEVSARRLGSPLDSLLRLTDDSGRVLAWNDDHEDKASGLLTHHADSYLAVTLPRDGAYVVQISDAQHHGGEAYGYRLRLGPPRPDFALRAVPSSLNVPPWRTTVVFRVQALRQDGFAGEIELALKDAPAGLSLSGARIPAGCDSIRLTLSAFGNPFDQPVALRLEGRARIGGQMVSRPVVPAEEMMQAFAYQHLVPSRQLLALVVGKRRAPLFALASEGPLRIPAGGTAEFQIKAPRLPILCGVQLELNDPPKGVTLQKVTEVPGGLALVLKADGPAAKAGLAGNLIVEAFTESAGGKPAAPAPKVKRRVSLGALPAISFEIVPR